jgi:hypothetical protein
MFSTDETISLIEENPYLNYRQLTDDEMDYFFGKMMKSIAKSIGKRVVKKTIKKAKLSPDEAAAFTKKADAALELTTESFRQGINSAPKVLGSFLAGMVQGGPVKAISESAKVWTAENTKQQADFVRRSLEAGFTVTVNGEHMKLQDPNDGFTVISQTPYVDPAQAAQRVKQQAIIITVVIIIIILMLI